MKENLAYTALIIIMLAVAFASGFDMGRHWDDPPALRPVPINPDAMAALYDRGLARHGKTAR